MPNVGEMIQHIILKASNNIERIEDEQTAPGKRKQDLMNSLYG
jgi:hypothetical protein